MPGREDHGDADAVGERVRAVASRRGPTRRTCSPGRRPRCAGGVEHRRRRRERETGIVRRAQQRQEGAGDAGRPAHVDVEHPAPLVVGEVGSTAPNSCTPTLEITRSAPPRRSATERGRGVDARPVGHIHLYPEATEPRWLRLRRPLAVAIEQRDAVAERRALLGEREPQARGAAGDDGDRHHAPGVVKSMWSRVSVRRRDPPARRRPSRRSRGSGRSRRGACRWARSRCR